MYQLIIAEKPSVAQSIAAVLGAKRRETRPIWRAAATSYRGASGISRS